jgi:NitT/TauT family transport system permease protein
MQADASAGGARVSSTVSASDAAVPSTVLAAPETADPGRQSTPSRLSAVGKVLRNALRNAWVQRLLTWGTLVVLLEWFAISVGSFFFPRLGDVLQGYLEVIRDGSLGLVASSFQQMLVGFGLATVIGVPLGLLIGTFRSVEWFLGPYINILFVTSLAAALPFLILVFGTGFEFRVAVVFLFCFFYVVINPAQGVRSVDRNIVEMSRSFNAGEAKRFFAITFPGTVPFIVAGMRLGLGQAIQGMIIAELWVTIGTGRKLTTLGLDRDLGEFFALASIIVLIGTLMTQALLWLQKRISPWSVDVLTSVKGAS